MKKFISYITAASLLLAQPYTVLSSEVTALAQETQYQSLYIVAEEEMSVTNGKFTVTYDAEWFKPAEVILSEPIESTLNVVNTEETGKIVIAFASATPVSVSDSFAEIKFERIAGDGYAQPYSSFSADELVTVNEKGEDIDISKDMVHLVKTSYGNPLTISGTPATAGEKFSININADKNFEFTNGILSVKYDPEILIFNGCGVNQALFGGLSAEFNETEPGVVKIAFISGSAICSSATVFSLSFTRLNDGNTDVILDADELIYTDSRGTELWIPMNPVHSNKSEEVPPSEETTVSPEKCDVSEDGVVSTADIIALARMITGLEKVTSAADVNGDCKVDSADLLAVISILKK